MKTKHYLIALITMAFITGFHGFAAASSNGSKGYNCSSCHPGRPDQTPPDSQVSVPNVVGRTQAAARTTITGAGLRVGTITTQTSSTVSSGSVISQNPAAATKAAQNSAVNLVVSSGPPAATNKPPVANAGPDQSVVEGRTVSLNGANSSDPDDGLASYAWKQTTGSTVALSNAAASSTTFTAPGAGANGTSLTFQLTVKDKAGLTATDTCIVNITPANVPPANTAPVANAGPDRTVDSGAVVVLDGSNSTDPDDGISSYLWKQTAGPAVKISSTTGVNPTFTAPAAGSTGAALTFQLTVTDSSGLKSTDTCIINVNPRGGASVNLPPVADAGPGQTARSRARVTLNASNSSDPDDGIASYRWKQTAGTPVTLFKSTVAKPVFRAPAARRSGISLTFRVTVTDKGGLKSSDTCIVQVAGSSGDDDSNDDDDD